MAEVFCHASVGCIEGGKHGAERRLFFAKLPVMLAIESMYLRWFQRVPFNSNMLWCLPIDASHKGKAKVRAGIRD